MDNLFKLLRQIRSTNDINKSITIYESYKYFNLSEKRIEELYNIYLSLEAETQGWWQGAGPEGGASLTSTWWSSPSTGRTCTGQCALFSPN